MAFLPPQSTVAMRAVAAPSAFMSLCHSESILCVQVRHVQGLRLFAGCQDCTVRVWDMVTFQSVATLHGHASPVTALAFFSAAGEALDADSGAPSRPSHMLSAAADSEVCVWSLRSNECVAKVPLARGTIYSIVTTGTDALFACQDTTVVTRPLASMLPSTQASGQTGPSEPAHTGGGDRAPGRVLHGHLGFVYALCLVQEGGRTLLVSGGGDGTIQVRQLPAPDIVAVLEGHDGAVLSLVAGVQLYSGGQDACIRVWDLETLHCRRILTGHTQEVYSLALCRTRGVLCSGSADGTVRVWDLQTFLCVSQLAEHCRPVLAVAAAADFFLSAGADHTIKIWNAPLCAGEPASAPPTPHAMHALPPLALPSTPAAAAAWSGGGSRLAAFTHAAAAVGAAAVEPALPGRLTSWGVPMLPPLTTSDAPLDSASVVSEHTPSRTVLLSPLPGVDAPDGLLRAHWRGEAPVARQAWGGDMGGEEDDSAAAVGPGHSGGLTQVPPGAFGAAGGGPAVSLVAAGLIAASGAPAVMAMPAAAPRVPALLRPPAPTATPVLAPAPRPAASPEEASAFMLALLRELVAIPSVSSDHATREHCWTAAKAIKGVLQALGAECTLVHPLPNMSPLLLARLGSDPSRPTVAFVAQYDVQPAGAAAAWHSPAFVLTGRDGYLYGRGATDNKGPLAAAITAAWEVTHAREAAANFLFIVEGEGEHGSKGFREAIAHPQAQPWLQGVSVLISSNNTWLADDRPCLTYGLRGLLQLAFRVTGPSRDLHSGVDGGVMAEPVLDLCAVVSSMVDNATGRCLVPGFYDAVRPVTEEELALYGDIEFDAEAYAEAVGAPLYDCDDEMLSVLLGGGSSGEGAGSEDSRDVVADSSAGDGGGTAAAGDSTVTAGAGTDPAPTESHRRIDHATQVLMRRWRLPTLSVHSMKTSAANASVVARWAQALISVRTVPDQDSDRLARQIAAHAHDQFSRLRTGNELQVRVLRSDRWWLGHPTSPHYRAMASAIEQHWGVPPMFVREGGTIRVMPFLEEHLGVPAITFPMGQSSDSAHLPNERIRLLNLQRGKEVLKSFFVACESIESVRSGV